MILARSLQLSTNLMLKHDFCGRNNRLAGLYWMEHCEQRRLAARWIFSNNLRPGHTLSSTAILK